MLGFGLFGIVAISIAIVAVNLIFVWCRYCHDHRGSKGLRFGLKVRTVAEISREYRGQRRVFMQVRRQGKTDSKHWDNSGHFTGTSESTHHWNESVPVYVDVYKRFYKCPDCGGSWSKIK
jgi:hypothetical protein